MLRTSDLQSISCVNTFVHTSFTPDQIAPVVLRQHQIRTCNEVVDLNREYHRDAMSAIDEIEGNITTFSWSPTRNVMARSVARLYNLHR